MPGRILGDPASLGDNDKERARFLRLMLSMNVLHTLHRPFMATMTDTCQSRTSMAVMMGDQMVFLSLIYGALSEGLDAYAAMRGTIEGLAQRAADVPQADIDRLRVACHKDTKDPSTFLNRIASRVRNAVGFHWDECAIATAMSAFLPGETELMCCYSSTSNEELARYTYADGLMAKVLFNQNSSDAIAPAVEEAKCVISAYFSVVEAALAQRMLDAGCRLTDHS